MQRSSTAGFIVAVTLACTPASAQRLDHPTPCMPRTPDGEPDRELDLLAPGRCGGR
jgi:hypothetical protein